MPETCGEAALYYEYEDTKKLMAHLVNVVNKKDLLEDMRKKSLHRGKYFTNIEDEININLEIFKKLTNKRLN